jgi:hypothetical protein
MLGSLFNVIYIGIPPKGGACITNPPQGIAVVTEFTFATGNWKDPDGISEFKFFYSFDDGNTFSLSNKILTLNLRSSTHLLQSSKQLM